MLDKQSSKYASNPNLMYILKNIFLFTELILYYTYALQKNKVLTRSKIMGSISKITMARNIIYKFRMGAVESNSKSMKLSVRTKSSFFIPKHDSIFCIRSSVGTILKVAICTIIRNR